MGEKQRQSRRWRGRDREPGQTCAVLLGHSSAHGLSARLKAILGFKREPWRFFFMFTKTYLFISPHSVIYLFISRCPSTPCSATGNMLDDAYMLAPLPLFFNTTAVENQTALKQIDVVFNIVVTSSQSPRASALVTTAGLLSLAQRLLPLCWLLQWFITKREGDRRVGREKTGETKEKSPGSWSSRWHLWLTRSNQLISILIKLIACGAARYLAWRELWARLGPPGPAPALSAYLNGTEINP